MIVLGVVALVCFTVIVIYRMAIDRMRLVLQHKRLVGDKEFVPIHERVAALPALPTTRPPKAAMPDFQGVIEKERAKREALAIIRGNQDRVVIINPAIEEFYYESMKEQR